MSFYLTCISNILVRQTKSNVTFSFNHQFARAKKNTLLQDSMAVVSFFFLHSLFAISSRCHMCLVSLAIYTHLPKKRAAKLLNTKHRHMAVLKQIIQLSNQVNKAKFDTRRQIEANNFAHRSFGALDTFIAVLLQLLSGVCMFIVRNFLTTTTHNSAHTLFGLNRTSKRESTEKKQTKNTAKFFFPFQIPFHAKNR